MGNASHGVLERLRQDSRFRLGYHYPLLLEAMIDLTHGAEAMSALNHEPTARAPAEVYQSDAHQPVTVTKEFGISRDPALIEALLNMADELHATIDVFSAAPSVSSPVYWSSGDPRNSVDGSVGAAIDHIYDLGETPIIAIGLPTTQSSRTIHVHLT